MGDPQAWDRYTYANNNPVRYNDPSGHCAGPFIAICLLVIEATPTIIEAATYALTAYIVTDQLKKEAPTVNGEQVNLGVVVLPGAPLLPGDQNDFNPTGSVNASTQNSPTNSFKPIEPYDVGTFEDLRVRSIPNDGLDLHHGPQVNPASQVIPNYDPKNAPTIALPKEDHWDMNATNIKGTFSGTPRDLLAKTLWDLRNYVPNDPLWKLLRFNEQKYPGVYDK